MKREGWTLLTTHRALGLGLRGGNKIKCPNCGHKEFVPYVSPDGRMPAGYGRCERVDKCRAHYKPWTDGLPARPEEVKQLSLEQKPEPPRVAIPSALFIEADTRYSAMRTGFGEAFKNWCRTLAPDTRESLAFEVLKAYHCTGTKARTGADGSTGIAFWFRDFKGQYTDAQLKAFVGLKSCKASSPTWAHTLLRGAGRLPGDARRYRCLFGEHLLACAEGCVIHIVEAPKTALMLAAYADINRISCCFIGKPYIGEKRNGLIKAQVGKHVFLAAGALGWLNYLALDPDYTRHYAEAFSRHVSVRLWPDLSKGDAAAKAWTNIAEACAAKYGGKWECYSDWAATLAAAGDEELGLDIADYITSPARRVRFDADMRVLGWELNAADYAPEPLAKPPAYEPQNAGQIQAQFAAAGLEIEPDDRPAHDPNWLIPRADLNAAPIEFSDSPF